MNEASELRSDIQELKADNTRLRSEENYLKAKLEATELRLRDANLQVAELESLARQSGMGYYHLITEELPEMVCATPRLAVYALIRKAKAAELQVEEYRKALKAISDTFNTGANATDVSMIAYRALKSEKQKCALECCKDSTEIGLICLCECHKGDGSVEAALKPMADMIGGVLKQADETVYCTCFPSIPCRVPGHV